MHPQTLRLRTSGPDQTRALGAAIASLLQPGDVVALSGELGAGKTCFVQGAAAGLGITDRVTSPTFVLVRVYDEGRLPIVHCDVYRLDHLQDVYDLGDEVLAPDVVTFVEWADAVAALLPDDRLEVDVLLADDVGPLGPPDDHADRGDDRAGIDGADDEVDPDGDREVIVTARGAWRARTPELVAVCAPWREVMA